MLSAQAVYRQRIVAATTNIQQLVSKADLFMRHAVEETPTAGRVLHTVSAVEVVYLTETHYSINV